MRNSVDAVTYKPVYTQVALPYHSSNLYPEGPVVDLLALSDDGSCSTQKEVLVCTCCFGGAHKDNSLNQVIKWHETDTRLAQDIVYSEVLDALGYAIEGPMVLDDGEYELYNIRPTN